MSEKKNILSPSKIKTLKSCSWLYWTRYVMGLPDSTNSGAQKGTLNHLIFELLGKERHRRHYDIILKKKDAFASKAIKRLVFKHLKKYNLLTTEHKEDVRQMLLAGLSYNFFGLEHGIPDEVVSEKPFEITEEKDDLKYSIRGFIDKCFIYKDLCVVHDYKSSKKAYVGDEVFDNVQHLSYVLVIHKLFPNVKKVIFKFLFLKNGAYDEYFNDDLPASITVDKDNQLIWPQKPVIDGFEIHGCAMKMEHKNKNELIGFEYELTSLQNQIDNFDEKAAINNLAAKMGWPTKEEGFCKALLCGRAKYPGELKKDGTKMWHCPQKFAYDYYSLINSQGEQIKSSYDEESLLKLKKKDYKIVKKFYEGCPAFRKEQKDF